MQWTITLVGFCLMFSAGFLRAGDAPVRHREAIVKVVDERGRPMAGVEVRLVGIGRDAAQADSFQSGHDGLEAWRFLSDGSGRGVVRFGCFSGFDSQTLTGKAEPGWGQFYLFAEKDGLRGVSPCIIHGGRKGIWTSDPDEWTRRGVIETRSRPVAVTLRMQRGIRVTGSVIDTEGKPVSGFGVRIENDLHSMHHTGYGDEIFRDSQTTDVEGRFAFEHVFPNTFYLGSDHLREESRPIWIHTRLRGRWLREPIYSVTPRRRESVIRMTLRVSRELTYRYFGRITDRAGKPVPNAKLAFGISRHRQPVTYEDNHAFLHATSDEAGRFELRTATPFVLWVHVTAEGHAEYRWEPEQWDRSRAPGEWNIRLERK